MCCVELGTRTGAVMAAVAALAICVGSAFNLIVHLETVLAGRQVDATVLTARGQPGYEREYWVAYPWDGERRDTSTLWLADGTRPGDTISIHVNRRDPGIVIGDGTIGMRIDRSLPYLFLAGLFAAVSWVLHRLWRRHNPHPRRRSSWSRIGPPVAPNRAQRRAGRRRG